MFKMVLVPDLFLTMIQRADRVLNQQMPRELKAIANRSAAYSRSNHAYINRTGTLQRNTVGRTERVSSSSYRVEIALRTSYAKYVIGRGLAATRGAGRRMRTDLTEYMRRVPGLIRRAV